jgi:hypothetical protein
MLFFFWFYLVSCVTCLCNLFCVHCPIVLSPVLYSLHQTASIVDLAILLSCRRMDVICVQHVRVSFLPGCIVLFVAFALFSYLSFLCVLFLLSSATLFSFFVSPRNCTLHYTVNLLFYIFWYPYSKSSSLTVCWHFVSFSRTAFSSSSPWIFSRLTAFFLILCCVIVSAAFA